MCDKSGFGLAFLCQRNHLLTVFKKILVLQSKCIQLSCETWSDDGSYKFIAFFIFRSLCFFQSNFIFDVISFSCLVSVTRGFPLSRIFPVRCTPVSKINREIPESWTWNNLTTKFFRQEGRNGIQKYRWLTSTKSASKFVHTRNVIEDDSRKNEGISV